MDKFSGDYFELVAFSAGKNIKHNEDLYGFNNSTIIVCDGATDKGNIKHELDEQTGQFKTGGEIASRIVIKTALSNDLCSRDFIDEVTRAMSRYYKDNLPEALNDPRCRFVAGGVVLARVINDELVITQIGDVAFRVNSVDEYRNNNKIDLINARIRKDYIDKSGDIDGGREQIMPNLKAQYKLHNNESDEYGFGVLDGTNVPDKFIHTYSFDLADIDTLEIATDGYYGNFPSSASVDAYEDMYQYIEKVDPYKINEFMATKVADDRTVVVVKF